MAPEHKNGDAGNSDMPKSSYKDESSLLNKERKKNYMLKLLRSVVRTRLVSMKLKKEKKILVIVLLLLLSYCALFIN